MNYSYIDLFAGAGGLSEGFQKSGFFPVAHVEADLHAAETLKTRAAYHFLKGKDINSYHKYISGEIAKEDLYALVPSKILKTVINETISNKSIGNIFSKIRENMSTFNVHDIDLIVGGPPCQPFSLMYRGRNKKSYYTDKRINLYKYYCKFLREFSPKIIVFENVPGLLSAGKNKEIFNKILKAIRSCGYTIDYRILNAKDFGVPQSRKRLIIIGSKEKSFKYPKFDKKENTNPILELLEDLPSVPPGTKGKDMCYSGNITTLLSGTGIRTPKDILVQHETRPNNEHDREIYKIAIQTLTKEHRRFKYTDLPKNMVTMKNSTDFLDRFKVVDPSQTYCHTLVAHISKDGHYYIHPDKKQLRSISVREAARIQSFEDNYFFEGPRTSIFKQIGNAVPPIMSQKIADKIKGVLNAKKL